MGPATKLQPQCVSKHALRRDLHGSLGCISVTTKSEPWPIHDAQHPPHNHVGPPWAQQ